MVKVEKKLISALVIAGVSFSCNIAAVKYTEWITYKKIATRIHKYGVTTFTAKTFDNHEVTIEMREKIRDE